MNLIAIPFRSTSEARCFEFWGAAAFSFLLFILDFFGLDGGRVLLIVSKNLCSSHPSGYHSNLAAHNENSSHWSLVFQDPIVPLLSGPRAVMALLPSALAYSAAGALSSAQSWLPGTRMPFGLPRRVILWRVSGLTQLVYSSSPTMLSFSFFLPPSAGAALASHQPLFPPS